MGRSKSRYNDWELSGLNHAAGREGGRDGESLPGEPPPMSAVDSGFEATVKHL